MPGFGYHAGYRVVAVALVILGGLGGGLGLWHTLDAPSEIPVFSTREALCSAGAGPVPEALILTAHWLHLEAGGTPAQALGEAGIKAEDVRNVLSALNRVMPVRSIQPRDSITLFTNCLGDLVSMELQRFPQRKIVVDSTAAGFVARREALPMEKRVRRLEGRVLSTVYEAMHQAGGDDGVLSSFADLFAWDFDFTTETREGDEFALLLEETWVQGHCLQGGRVLYGEYTPVKSRPMAAYYYEGSQPGLRGYYDAGGRSIRKRFLKSPLNFARISSYFSHHRMHPILKRPRPHLGIDYAAPTGTPVVAIGAGRVTFAGWIKGFGKTVKIRHGDGYLSQYGHLSRIRVRKNARVKQNDLVGNVGSTGLATGPHLDFRVQKKGSWVNPLHLNGGSSAPPLPQSQLQRFRAYTAALSGVFSGLGAGESVVWAGPSALGRDTNLTE